MTVRIGIIGPGGMGQAHIARFEHEVAGGHIVAVQDIDTQRARNVADPLGAKVFEKAKDLIESDEVDAVMVTSFGPAHAESVLQTIAAGKPVFCEKPLSPSIEECISVLKAESDAGKRLTTLGFMRRFDPSYVQMKRVIDSGEQGQPIMVHCAHRNPTVPESYTWDMAITDTAVHEIDTTRWLLGEEFVSARVDKPKKTRNRFPHLQDPLILILESESGVRVDDEVFVNIQYGYDIRCEIVSETGVVSLTDQNVTERRDSGGRHNGLPMDHNQRFPHAFRLELQSWIDSINAGEQRGPNAWDGYAATVVGAAGVAALTSEGGAAVPIAMIDKPELYR